MAEGRFIFVYHEDLQQNYPALWDDNAALATWLRLFALADKQWPSPAEMPRAAKASIVKRLVEYGLIFPEPNHRYRVRGLDTQRQRRSEQAKAAAAARYADSSALSSADGSSTGNASRARASGTGSGDVQPASGELGSGEEGADALVAYHSLTGRFPNGRVREWLDTLVSEFTDADVEKALAEEMIADRSVQTLLSRTENRLRLAAHDAEKRRQSQVAKHEADRLRQIEEMPPEQRRANLDRLADMMAEKGLHPKTAGKPA